MFTGPDEETRIALEYMRPAWGETVMDLSCGSGLFSRRFIKSGEHFFYGIVLNTAFVKNGLAISLLRSKNVEMT